MTTNMSRRAVEIEDQTNLLPTKKLVVVITVLSTSLLICYVDQNSIAVALPTIANELDCADSVQWAGTSALIANTVFQILYGRLSDILGRNTILFVSLAFLALGDLLCGLARSGPQLYAFRALAGIGNGGINALAMIITTDVVTLERRGKYQGIIGACVGIGNTIGPFLAAVFVEKASWRYLFFMLCGLSATSGLLSFFVLPSTKLQDDTLTRLKKIDYWGTLFSSAAVVFLLIPISDGGVGFPWDSPTVVSLLVVGSVCTVLFLLVEWKFAMLPMMPPHLFKNLALNVVMVQNFLFGIVYYSSLYYLPTYYQNARRWNPSVSAALTIPIVVAQSVSSVLSGQYISCRKRYLEVLWTGYVLWTIGAGLRCLFGKTTAPVAIVFVLLLEGLGAGLTFQPTLIAAHAHSDNADRAIIVGIRNFVRCLGGACGLAISAAIYSNVYRRHAPAAAPSSIYAQPDLSSLPGPQQIQIQVAYLAASRAVFIFWAPVIGLCLLSMVFIKDQGLSRPEKDDGDVETEGSDDSEGVIMQPLQSSAGKSQKGGLLL
ncbi:hypothetical protein VTK73DRAFT_9744 [Phialemonium thermophilum]|uniref:Major facilitator superfamily (MFS) profile domain-containing protein n=1 Tax=Phialemonium thermophilum TaxID=223376 RepID=A0ABR3W0J4_9PEZI